MDEASEERSRNVTDAPRLVYVIIFMPTCGQKDILALKFYRYHLSEYVQTEFDNQSFYSPTDAQMNCLKSNIKIYIKTAPTCFGAVAPSSGSALFVLAKVTFVKTVN
jgi:hypothetical protein